MYTSAKLRLHAGAFLLTCLLLLVTAVSHAQLSADFEVNRAGGCAPVTIFFTNTTTGASAAAKYKWEFGNGSTSQVPSNVAATFKEEKTYTVTLTVTDGGQVATRQKTVTAYKKPTIDFSYVPSGGCIPVAVSFTSSSTPGDGSIASYLWDYGDGTTEEGANLQQVSHTYDFAQKASVSLTVTNSFGCFATLEKAQIVDAKGGVKAAFTANKTGLCRTDEVVQFEDKSTPLGTYTYLWEFGDGQTSTEKAPSHVYNQQGVFPVKLTVTPANGCPGIAQKDSFIHVSSFTADFEAPQVSCEGSQVLLVNKSLPLPTSSRWEFENLPPVSTTRDQVTVTFPTAGPQQVKLTNMYGACSETVTKTVDIAAKPQAQPFDAVFTTACGAPATLNFRDNTPGAVAWQWNLDGDAARVPESTEQAPVYTYNKNGQYRVRLQVANAAGCIDSVFKTVTVKNQVIRITVTKSTSTGVPGISCAPFTMDFATTSTDPIKSYNWILNDVPVSTSATPQLSFSTLGTYTLKLEYTTEGGCTGVATYPTIAYYQQPVVDFASQSGTTICGNSPVQFSSNVVSGTATQWRWNFGQGAASVGTGATTTYKYTSGGTFDVTLVASNGGCETKVTKPAYITVLPPFPDIAAAKNACLDNRGTVTFTQASKQVLSGEWDFGDGTRLPFDAAATEIKHAYSRSGAYNVVLTATNGQCVVKDSLTAYVLLKQAPTLTTARTQICSNESLQVTVAGLEANPYAPNPNYKLTKFIYGDGTDFAGTGVNLEQLWKAPFSATLGGFELKDNLKAVVRSEYFGCFDTTNVVPLDVRGPAASFSLAASAFCFNKPVVFTDKSRAGNNVPIKTWEWNFGDNTTVTNTTGNAVTHAYAGPGNYVATLKVTDEEGCFAVFKAADTLRASGPQAKAAASDTSVMVGSTVNFYNRTLDYNSTDTKVKWFFTDGTTSTLENPVKKYTVGQVDSVRLVASSATTGCTDEAIVAVKVKIVNVAFTTTTKYQNGDQCPPLLARFTNTSVNIDSFYWDFGDGSAAGKTYSPSHTYEKPGEYTVKLYGYAGNLEDNVQTIIHVAGPTATLSADKLFGCNSQTVTLKADIKDATTFIWNMGDGTLKQVQDQTVVHTYASPGVYQPSLILNDNSGCASSFELADTIVIDSLAVSLKNSDTKFCDEAEINFVPEIRSIAADEAGKELTYRWDFGTGRAGDIQTVRDASFHYSQPGDYTVKLQVVSPYGCRQEVSLPIQVNPTPKAGITGPDNVCVDAPATFKGTVDVSGPVEWKWSFGNGNRPEVQNPEPQYFSEADEEQPIRLVVKSKGCTDTARAILAINPRPRLEISASKTNLCPNETVQLTAEGGSSRTWSPARWLSDATDKNPKAKPQATIMYTVTNVSSKGCTNTDSILLTVATKFDLISNDTSVCMGRSVQLNAAGGDVYLWSAANMAEINDVHSPRPVVTPTATSGHTDYTVKVVDSLGCFPQETVIRVNINPLPSVNAGPDAEVLAASPYQLQPTASSDVTKWRWLPADYLDCNTCPSPTATPKSPITYGVRVLNQYGCEATDTVNIRLFCNGAGQVYIPNAFTPNYDGKNDVFYIKGMGISNIKSLQIFNRWGDVVFLKTNFAIDDRSAGWNGMYKNQLVPTGTYIYFVELQCGEETFQQKGTVTVVY
ncbi:PKD domain-containing protein [Paraflavisolibacter sp. H34]|uniref:PKD domain-containing protein n=1 Tax=Huijunlia imazamoxiresistens TaxID=3127457 RepID=UPI003018866C